MVNSLRVMLKIDSPITTSKLDTRTETSIANPRLGCSLPADEVGFLVVARPPMRRSGRFLFAIILLSPIKYSRVKIKAPISSFVFPRHRHGNQRFVGRTFCSFNCSREWRRFIVTTCRIMAVNIC